MPKNLEVVTLHTWCAVELSQIHVKRGQWCQLLLPHPTEKDRFEIIEVSVWEDGSYHLYRTEGVPDLVTWEE